HNRLHQPAAYEAHTAKRPSRLLPLLSLDPWHWPPQCRWLAGDPSSREFSQSGCLHRLPGAGCQGTRLWVLPRQAQADQAGKRGDEAPALQCCTRRGSYSLLEKILSVSLGERLFHYSGNGGLGQEDGARG